MCYTIDEEDGFDGPRFATHTQMMMMMVVVVMLASWLVTCHYEVLV